MKIVITTLYFTVMAFVVASLIADLGYTYPDALFVSTTYLPSIVLAHKLSNGFRSKANANPVGAISLIVAIFILQLLFITLANYAIDKLSYQITMPDIVINPVLVFLIFMLYYLPYRILVVRLFKEDRAEAGSRQIDFVSNRRRVTLAVRDILYVESRDTEVWLHTIGGESFRSKTNISGWERELEGDFLRIHRSYIVNIAHTKRVDDTSVELVTGVQLDVSRSYRSKLQGSTIA